MKKRLALLLVFVFLLELMPTALAKIGTDWNDDCRANPIGGDATGTTTYGKHNWVKIDEDPGNGCNLPGIAIYRCSYCGATTSRDTNPPGHKWGGWTVTRTPTCTTTGTRVRTCTVCQQQETETMAKSDHAYGAWVILQEATCQSTGSQQRVCMDCGHVETKTIAKTKDHNYGSWKIIREATCAKTGLRQRVCRTCGAKQEQKIKKTDHQYTDWEIIVECTDHSAGVRSHTCVWCGKTEKEEFDPEGTLRRGDKGSEVKEMQEILADFGYMKTSQAKGTFNANTEKAVGKFQKDRGLTSDGVAWPQTRALLRHSWSDWEIVIETTPFSAGRRRRTCADCGKVEEEDFDPEGTLRRDDEGEAVKEIQIALKGLGLFKYNTTGAFGKNTENSVKKFQKSKGLKADGVAWPGVIELLTGKKPKLPKEPEAPILPEAPEKIPPEDETGSGDLPAAEGGLQLGMEFLGTQARKAKEGDRLALEIRVTNTGKKKLSVVALGCPTGLEEDGLDAKDFKTELEPGESTEFRYGMYVTKEALAQEFAERTFYVKATDYDTSEVVEVNKTAVIGILRDGPAILLLHEDVEGKTILEGETADVTFWCINVGDTDLTDLRFQLYDEQYDTPALDSLINLPGDKNLSELWPSGYGFEFQYHVQATAADTAGGHVWRALHASAKDAVTGEETGVLNFFMMDLGKIGKIKPELPGLEKVPEEKDPYITVTSHDETPAEAVEGEHAAFGLTITNLGEMEVMFSGISHLAGDILSEEAWMKNPLEPGKGYEMQYATMILPEDIVKGRIEREIIVVVKDPKTEKTGMAKTDVTIELLGKEIKPPKLPDALSNYLKLEKAIIGLPIKGAFYADDPINYELTLTNTSKTETAKNVVLNDTRLGLHKNFGDILPGESVTTTCIYTVTKLDAMMPYILNTASASWEDTDGNAHVSVSNTVSAPTGVEPDELLSLHLYKEVISTPKKFDFYQEGDEIEFRITATNTGNVTIGYAEITDILQEKDMGKIGEVSSLAPSESFMVTFKYKVTGSDVAAGKVVNTASAVCFAEGFIPITVVSNEVECLTGVLPENLTDGLNLVKAEVSKPKNGSFYVEGETIKYAITLINNYKIQMFGTVSLWVMDGIINDLLEPAPGKIADVMDLYPGHSITVPYSYKVTAFDVGKGEVINMATFEGEMSDDTTAQIVSNEVISPTGAYTGKPKGGTICVRTLHQHSASSENETLEYCTEHAAVAETVQKLVSRAVTESELLSAWQTAIEIWNEALNDEYRDRLAHADAVTAAAIQSEWVQFHLQVANCRNALIKKAGGENSTIAREIAEMLMNHCADLCGEAGLSAAQRKDSVLDAQKAMDMGLSPAKCLKQSVAIENGMSTTTVLCADHQRTEKLVDLMLEGLTAADQEALVQIFERSADLWTVELDREANERFTTASDGGQIYILERVTFGEWLAARKIMLRCEYPNNPEIVQELIARAIRERVMLICAQD